MRGAGFHGEGAHTIECILVSAVTLTKYPAPPRTRMQNKAQIAQYPLLVLVSFPRT